MNTFRDEDNETECENVKVVIRIRPLNEKELNEGQETIASVDEDRVISLLKQNRPSKSFRFDRIFTENSTQLHLYKHTAYPIVDKALQGYNGTILAYGQTGSGKTYTMMGRENEMDHQGVIPNAFSHIFGQISRYGVEKSFVVTATYLEIYNEDVRDLLSNDINVKLEVRERTDVGVYVKGLVGFTIDSVESMKELMRLGNRNRMTKSTLMNRNSSRSHAIFTISIEAKDKNNNRTTVGKLNLVDLAGSERLHKTKATGDRLREATNINQSLSVLGSVISALIDGKSTHIPYRNSKLTRLLQDSLGGNSKTAMIATISPSQYDFEESICTLRYASRVKYIKNKLKINVETKRGLIESFEDEIAKLQRRISLIQLKEEKTSLKLTGRKSKASIEKDRVYEEELAKAEEEREELLQKIALIQKKILIGGENLYEKAQQQMFLLRLSDVELDILNKSHQDLEEQIHKTEIERINVTEEFSNLQDEDIALNDKIRAVQLLLAESREEYADKEHEYQREIEILTDDCRALWKESQLADFVIGKTVPNRFRVEIEDNLMWNPEIDEFQLRGLQHAGNNLRESSFDRRDLSGIGRCDDLKHVYGSYRQKRKSNKRKS